MASRGVVARFGAASDPVGTTASTASRCRLAAHGIASEQGRAFLRIG